MSFIISNTNFVSIKLTDKGREQIAKGNLNFSFWSIGDSEINYSREDIREGGLNVPSLSADARILLPKDKNPDIKYRLTSGSTDDGFRVLNQSNIVTQKITVNNKAKTRGFFSGNSIDGYSTLTETPFVKTFSYIDNIYLSGGNTLFVGSGLNISIGDTILLKYYNQNIGTKPIGENETPVPNYFYKVQNYVGNNLILDRVIPNDGISGTSSQYYIYQGGEVYNGIGSGTTTTYWDTNTLSFNSSYDVSCFDIPIWNMNIPFSESIVGVVGNLEKFPYYGSQDYLGIKDAYLGYGDIQDNTVTFNCDGFNSDDDYKKSIAIIHYTNNAISNFYGEFLYHNESLNKRVVINIPDLMYHRREFSGSTNGNVMGMTFMSSGEPKNVGLDIEYVDLVDDPSLVTEPKVVGKVFTQLKLIVIDDEEIVSAISYKSGRNWTLPKLKASLSNPTSLGALEPNKTMYLTYRLSNDSGNGQTRSLHCQNFIKITNTSTTNKDVDFTLESTGLLPYMRKLESMTYDGLGFYADKFEVLFQIVDNVNDRPTEIWQTFDYTTTSITTNTGETIDPLLLENQNPITNSFKITDNIIASSNIYLSQIQVPSQLQPNILQFGDEKFFYGNVDSSIGATIYKTLFRFNIQPTDFNSTTNVTKGDVNTNVRITEIGVYDDQYNLVLIGKLAKPYEINNNITQIDLSIDF